MISESSDLTRDGVIRTLRRTLEGRTDVELALLFGSWARGQARRDASRDVERSDVDVAVEGAGLDLLGLAADLSRALRLEVQVVDIRRAGYVLLKQLLRDAILLHEGSPHAAARFRTRAILQVENDRPYFERMHDAFLERLAEGAGG